MHAMCRKTKLLNLWKEAAFSKWWKSRFHDSESISRIPQQLQYLDY
jgi:hypothetical protein